MIEVNRRFAEQRPDVPLHLGVTEAGLPPDGIIKTRIAFEQLISRGIGDTIRVSLTVPNARKPEEIAAGRQILADIAAGRVRTVVDYGLSTLNIISCPSCSRVENEAFVELAQQVKEMTDYAEDHHITIAVMGCRVNGPGETDDADLGPLVRPELRESQTRQRGAGRVSVRRDPAAAEAGTRRADCPAEGRRDVSQSRFRSRRLIFAEPAAAPAIIPAFLPGHGGPKWTQGHGNLFHAECGTAADRCDRRLRCGCRLRDVATGRSERWRCRTSTLSRSINW